MTKWFIEAPNSILDTENTFLEKKRLSSRSPLSLPGKNRDIPSFSVEFISILIFHINYQVLTTPKIPDFMVYETAQVFIGWSGGTLIMFIW